jgi:hypothetical protein
MVSKHTTRSISALTSILASGLYLKKKDHLKLSCDSNTESSEKNTAPTEIRIPPREDCVKRLKSGEVFDVLIIGGGATGAGAGN